MTNSQHEQDLLGLNDTIQQTLQRSGSTNSDNRSDGRESTTSSAGYTDALSEEALVGSTTGIITPHAPQAADDAPTICKLSPIKKSVTPHQGKAEEPDPTTEVAAALEKQDSESYVSTAASDPDLEGGSPKKLDKTVDDSGFDGDEEYEELLGGCYAPAKYMRRLMLTMFGVVFILVAVVLAIALPESESQTNPGAPPSKPPIDPPTQQPPSTPPTQQPPSTPPTQQPPPTRSPILPSDPTAAPIGLTASPISLTASPIASPTASPTLAPTTHEMFELFAGWSGADVLTDKSTPQAKAYEWMTQSDQLAVEGEAIKQRYAIATVFFSVAENDDDMIPEEYQTQHECDWPTISCNGTTQALGINLSPSVQYRSLAGTIPGNELALLSTLTSIDLSENNIRGNIPEELYSLTKLTGLYLHHNLLTGTISSRIGDLWDIRDIYLNHNQLNGSIPRELRSQSVIRPLRYLHLNNNRITGPIPSGLRLRDLFLVDLSFNQMTGTIPEDFGLTAVKLWHLYLEHNQFRGQIPESIATMGNGRVIDLVVNDNQFTGSVPTEWSKGNTFMLTMRVHNNMFTETLDKNVCKMDVFLGGEMVELSADCNICSCENFCDKCFIDGVRQGADPLMVDQFLP